MNVERLISKYFDDGGRVYNKIYHYNSNLIRDVGSRLVDRRGSLDQTRRSASRLIWWSVPVNLTWSGTSDQVTVIIIYISSCKNYTTFFSSFQSPVNKKHSIVQIKIGPSFMKHNQVHSYLKILFSFQILIDMTIFDTCNTCKYMFIHK